MGEFAEPPYYSDAEKKEFKRKAKEQLKLNKTLWRCIVRQKNGMISSLLQAGADPNYVHKFNLYESAIYLSEANNQPLLNVAIFGDNKTLVKTLLDHGANVNICYKGLTFTPLVQALFYKKHDIAKLLLERGADPFLQADSGYHALDLAKDANFVDIVDMINRKRAQKSQENIKEIDQKEVENDLSVANKICLTEVVGSNLVEYWYDFNKEERLTMVKDATGQKTQAVSVNTFSDISKSALTEAFNMYKERGGQKALNDLLHPMLKDKPSYIPPKQP